MKQQTAIEWLIEQCPGITQIVPWDMIEHSIQMEKEQINKACYDGYYLKDEKYTYKYYNENYEK